MSELERMYPYLGVRAERAVKEEAMRIVQRESLHWYLAVEKARRLVSANPYLPR